MEISNGSKHTASYVGRERRVGGLDSGQRSNYLLEKNGMKKNSHKAREVRLQTSRNKLFNLTRSCVATQNTN